LLKIIKSKKIDDNKILAGSGAPKISFPRPEEKIAKKPAATVDESKIEAVKPKTLAEKMFEDGMTLNPDAVNYSEKVSEFGQNKDKIPRDTKTELSSASTAVMSSSEVMPAPHPVVSAKPEISVNNDGTTSFVGIADKVAGAAQQNIPTPDMSIEEEDGLPVVMMPEELMVMPKMVDLKNFPPKTKNIDNIPTTKSPQREINSILQESEIPIEKNEKLKISEHDLATRAPVLEKKPEILPSPTPTAYSSNKNIPQRIIEAQNTRRPIVDGVRLAKKLTGPIEELGEMTLIEFRRLAPNPQAATDEIRERISLLQDESFARKMEGVDAWLKNEVNKFYRLLGCTAMDQHRNIDEVIKERLLSGKPTLTSEEFDAIMKLNKDLRY